MSNEDIERAASAVAGPISGHIDSMLSQLQEGTSLEEVASALVAQLGTWSNHPDPRPSRDSRERPKGAFPEA
jgi:hypothetical protein